ncbi:dGTP triphosphohydrolase [Neobacillus sp. PS3-40]|uniref:dGTP triphosphohydrolase n=1 Tax=Neobacillus sp. PS3-40 TaxID=3070679 RepID=UPI0027DF9AC1|nr:dNTP triphosphohydrolase [Neobacillus sp. PS3-40]WML44336.1 dNTP triphosphohydrolase [Neobacillus sp. PS3-40]
METNIKWRNLLNENRGKDKHKKPEQIEAEQKEKEERKSADINMIHDHRNEFERDYDRIMNSSSLRRLQDKAQVFPLQESDFIRTRLTHSMEVSSIARSFGVWLEKWLIEVNKELNIDDYGKIPAMLATAGLAHDLGNPPYGHYGEDVIKNWFSNYFKKNEGIDLTDPQKNDFINFDGNAQGIRILTRLQFLNDQFGINFTYGTLSILLKYPFDSSNDYAIKNRKFGYFQQDIEMGKGIIQETVKIAGKRNPLTYFLEAADDIAYFGSDVEDGVKKKIIPWEKVFEEHIIENDKYKIYEAYKDGIDTLKIKHEKAKNNGFPDYLLTSVQNFKVWAQGQMIREVKEVFVENYEQIMNGEFDEDEFLKKTKNAHLLRKFLKGLLKEYIFPNKEVLSLELVGDSVLSHLLTTFVEQCIFDETDFENESKPKAGKLLRMISENFVFVHLIDDDYENPKKGKELKAIDTYSKLLLVTDFISGMSDSYALDLHQKLKGVKMP